LHFNRTFNSVQRLTGSTISTQTFPQGIRLPSTTVGTKSCVIRYLPLNPYALGPIARGGYVFLPQSNVSVRIQQIQLEQVPSAFDVHAGL
jgi:hypothetical protein